MVDQYWAGNGFELVAGTEVHSLLKIVDLEKDFDWVKYFVVIPVNDSNSNC